MRRIQRTTLRDAASATAAAAAAAAGVGEATRDKPSPLNVRRWSQGYGLRGAGVLLARGWRVACTGRMVQGRDLPHPLQRVAPSRRQTKRKRPFLCFQSLLLLHLLGRQLAQDGRVGVVEHGGLGHRGRSCRSRCGCCCCSRGRRRAWPWRCCAPTPSTGLLLVSLPPDLCRRRVSERRVDRCHAPRCENAFTARPRMRRGGLLVLLKGGFWDDGRARTPTSAHLNGGVWCEKAHLRDSEKGAAAPSAAVPTTQQGEGIV
mmetsp:Transcript_14543/g.42501  ORF Transcript_14543/g.42501 Transcript_14543/m.42501 type:complete len:260 (+) Transcript_14543:129-908(+)